MKYKREVGLEKLRDDLDLFLRVLKSSMVELINRDFADFLNLSTNLVRRNICKINKNEIFYLGWI